MSPATVRSLRSPFRVVRPGVFSASLLSGRAGVTRVSACLPGLRFAVRVAVLSDLHYGPLVGAGQLERWVDLALGCSPDLVALPGDLCDVRLERGLPERLLRALGRLRAPLGVFAVWGNHDYASFGRTSSRWTGAPHDGWEGAREAFTLALAGVGVRVLLNAGVSVRPDVWLGGVDDLTTGDPDAAAALAGRRDGQATLLLLHQPDALNALAGVAGWSPGALALCGHTHGGQIRTPGRDRSGEPGRPGRRVEGWVTGEEHAGRRGARGHVSRGLGVTGVPLRLFCPPQVVLYEFTPER